MAIVPDRNEDQVKVTGAKLHDLVEHRENFDGGLGKLERKPGTGGIYASEPNSPGGRLGVVNPKTGFFTPIQPFLGTSAGITEIEWSPDGKTLYATGGGGDSAIYTIDPDTGETLSRTALSVSGGAVNGLEFVTGTLLGTFITSAGGASTLVSIVPSTGVITSIGATGFGPIGGLAYHAPTAKLYGITSAGVVPPVLALVNQSTGAAAPIALVGGVYFTAGMASLEFTADGTLIAGGHDGFLYAIDTTTAAATRLGPLGPAGSKISGLSMRPIFSGPRVHDLGITERDHVAQSTQRVLRQDVKKSGGSPGLVGPEKSGGLLFPTGDADKNI